MSKYILLSPHSDDAALFASIVCQRYHPEVWVVTDSFIQYERGQHDITAHRRRDEDRAACKVMGVEVKFLGIADDCLKWWQQLDASLPHIGKIADHKLIVFIPALQGGHKHHDLVNEVQADVVFDAYNTTFIEYSTYAAGQNVTPIETFIELKPTDAEATVKAEALACYTSQFWQGHMHAVNGYTSEWLSRLP
jgi:LmbE family N-acetylglucosaminyl deacetylase